MIITKIITANTTIKFPAGCSRIDYEMVGGGGGGGGASGGSNAGGPGLGAGGGGSSVKVRGSFTAVPNRIYNLNVGTAGTAGTAGPAGGGAAGDGGIGGDSSIVDSTNSNILALARGASGGQHSLVGTIGKGGTSVPAFVAGGPSTAFDQNTTQMPGSGGAGSVTTVAGSSGQLLAECNGDISPSTTAFTPGSGGTAGAAAGAGGGGGQGAYGSGGNGAAGPASGSGLTGSAPATANSGAGGGGASGGSGVAGLTPGGAGGAGSAGRIVIWYSI